MPDTVVTLPPIISKEVYSQSSLSEIVDWGLKMVGIPEAWKTTKGDGIVVGVADTGVQLDHPDLKDNILDAKDFTNSPSGPSDGQGHGSHTSSIVAAIDNNQGIIGVAPHAKIVMAKVLGDAGQGMGSWVAKGVDWLVSKGVDIISMSLGSSDPDPEIMVSVQRAVMAGKFVICAAGNDGSRGNIDTVNFPARWGFTVAVGAVDNQGKVCSFSSRGSEVDIVAPGQDIMGCWPGSRYCKLSGSSMAAPFVSGVTALMLAQHRKLGEAVKTPLTNVSELKDHLKRTATGSGQHDADRGWGIINPDKLMVDEARSSVLSTSSPPPPSPECLSFIIPNVILAGQSGKLIWVAD